MNRYMILYVMVFHSMSVISAQQKTDSSLIETQSEWSQQFRFDANTESQDVAFVIEETINKLNLLFEGVITKGGLIIEVLDPNGKRVGGLTLEGLENSDSKYQLDDYGHSYARRNTSGGQAHGSMKKVITYPLSGTWHIKIKSEQLTGHFRLSISQAQSMSRG